MKRVLLAGGGQTHVLVLHQLARRSLARDAENLDITVVTPSESLPYSGMLPGWMAGHYRLDEFLIPMAPLARAAGARLVLANVQTLDLAASEVITDTAEKLRFDTLSIATGSIIDVEAITGARTHALPLRPLDAFITGWQQILQRASVTHRVLQVTVIGGGAAGVEAALAAAYRARSLRLRVQLITGRLPLLPGHGTRARALMHAALLANSVSVVEATVVEIGADRIMLDSGQSLSTDATLLSTGAAADTWPRAAGLETDQRGFIAVDAHLRSTSHPIVFAAGDAATLTHSPRAKSGVYAVRAATPLAYNLMAAATGRPLEQFRPQRRALYLLTTGAKRAIASWGEWAVAGRWIWRWKDSIDRDYIAKLTNSETISNTDKPTRSAP